MEDEGAKAYRLQKYANEARGQRPALIDRELSELAERCGFHIHVVPSGVYQITPIGYDTDHPATAPLPLPPPDPAAVARALAVPPHETRAERRERQRRERGE